MCTYSTYLSQYRLDTPVHPRAPYVVLINSIGLVMGLRYTLQSSNLTLMYYLPAPSKWAAALTYLSVKLEGSVTLTTVLSVRVVSHEDTSTTVRTLSSQSLDLTVVVNLVVGQDSQLVLSVLVLDLLWGGVDLLLSLLTTTSQSQHQVKSGLLLDVVVRQGSAVLQLLTSEDQSLLVRWDSLLILDLGLNIVDGVRGLDFQGNGLTCQGLNENLHTGLSAAEVLLSYQ